tara:strand:+ start:4929 stop:5321 length:393 start_codon:yes stop_codon:yes gene_type:complete
VRALLVAAACAPLLSGCLIYADDSGETVMVRLNADHAVTTSTAPETLRAVRFADGALIVRVHSSGCTTAADFAVSVAEGTPANLTLTRTRPDLCKAIVPEGVELRWTFEELGLAPGSRFSVENLYQVPLT